MFGERERDEAMKKSCIDCGSVKCNEGEGRYPDFCLTCEMEEAWKSKVMEQYEGGQNKAAMIAAAEVEYEGYCRLTRIEEIMEFAKKTGAHKLGIATCVGLIRESRILGRIFRKHGFEVVGVGCKVGAIDKTSVGIQQKCEAIGCHMCNPIMQAEVLNKEQTDLNVVVGLCVGHDSLFYQYSNALCTTAVTKDRVLGHNPAAALYTAQSYYKKLMPEEEK